MENGRMNGVLMGLDNNTFPNKQDKQIHASAESRPEQSSKLKLNIEHDDRP